jgi:hypothetical protein
MNCHAAQRLLSVARDTALGGVASGERPLDATALDATALDAPARGELAAHVAGCAACRRFEATLAEAADAWRATTAAARVPDAQLEWQHLSRRMREGAAPPARSVRRPSSLVKSWAGLSLACATAAVAVAAVALLVGRGFFSGDASSASDRSTIVASAGSRAGAGAGAAAVARADFVEVGGDAAATVFVDEKSGWLVVWAAAAD